jgi:hypothetical protein
VDIGSSTSYWPGHFNATVYVPAISQALDIYQIANQIVGGAPVFMEFTHSSYASFSISNSATISLSGSVNFGGLGAAGSLQYTTNSIYSAKLGNNLEAGMAVTYSGTTALDAVHGFTVTIPVWTAVGSSSFTQSSTLYPEYLNPPSIPNPCGPSTNPSCYTLGPGNTHTTSFTLSGTISASAGIDGSVCVDLLIVSYCSNVQFGISASGSASETVSFTLDTTSLPNTHAAINFEVYAEGSLTSGDALVLHIWEY